MPTRIRYEKHSTENKLVSVQEFVGQRDALYKVILDLDSMTYKIRNVRRQRYVRSTEMDGKKPPKHLNTLKTQAREALKSMGVKFDLDLRGINL